MKQLPRSELSNEERQEAFAYVDGVVAGAEGKATATSEHPGDSLPSSRPLVARLVPGFLKRAYVRTLRYALRHPFDHLVHPVETRLEQQIGETRGLAQSALRRSEQTAAALERLRSQLEKRKP